MGKMDMGNYLYRNGRRKLNEKDPRSEYPTLDFLLIIFH